MYRIFCRLIAVVVLFALAAGDAAAQTRQKMTMTFGGFGMHYFPLYVAKGAGFFEREGLDVEIVDVGSGTRQAAAVMGGSADMAPLGFFHVIKARGESADLVAISALFDVYGMTIVLSNEAIARAGIEPGMSLDERVKRLAGMKIGISSPGSSTDALIRSVLTARGHDPDKMASLQPFGSGSSILAAFEKKLSDGFVYVAPLPEIVEHKKLGRSVIDPFLGEVPELNGVPYVVMVSSRATLKAKGDLVQRGLVAVAKAMDFLRTNPEETAKAVRPFFTSLDEPVFRAAVERYRKASAGTLDLTSEHVAKTVAWMNIGAKTKTEAKFEDVVAAEFMKAAIAASKAK